jgi:ABC-type sulfate transport system permease component
MDMKEVFFVWPKTISGIVLGQSPPLTRKWGDKLSIFVAPSLAGIILARVDHSRPRDVAYFGL